MMADICEEVGADVTQVALGMGLDPRIGREFLNAGIGFGGYCFPKDLRAFMHLAREHGVDCGLLKEVENINLRRAALFLKKVRRAVWVLQGKRMGVLGLAFKGGTDDIRESPALRIVKALLEEGARLRVHDPQAMEATRQELPPQAGRLEYCPSPYEAAREAHALLIVTDWKEYRELDLARLHVLMEVPVIVDGRNLLNPEAARSAGFEYVDMGRSSRAKQWVPRLKAHRSVTANNGRSQPGRPPAPTHLFFRLRAPTVERSLLLLKSSMRKHRVHRGVEVVEFEDPVPHPAEQPVRLTIGELSRPAVLRSGGFPLFIRKPIRQTQSHDIAFNLFFGGPF